MTADIVNLRQRRKRAARQQREAGAAANRARSGETKAQKEARSKNEALERAKLDGQRRDPE